MNARHPTETTPADCGGEPFRLVRGALYLLCCAIRVSVRIRLLSARLYAAQFMSSLFFAWVVAGASLGLATTVIILTLWWDAIRKIVAG